MPVIGQPRRFDLKYNFQVEIDGLGSADFKSCSEPTITVGEALLWQGGSMIPVKEPTRLTFADITLERGSSRDLDLWTWLKTVGDAASSRGLPSPLSKRHGSIVQRDRAGIPVERLEMFFAWPKEYSPGDWDNDSDDFRMERVVLAMDYYERIPLVAI
jgi:phage tail-like protein